MRPSTDWRTQGKIDATLAEALGRAVAAAHAAAPVAEPAPWIAALADYIDQNDAAFGSMPELFPAPRWTYCRMRAVPPMRAPARFWSSAGSAV